VSQRLASDLHKRWARLKPPLRPPPVVIDAMLSLIADCPGKRLLLGVTPELAVAAGDVVAVDWSRPMIEGVWPGSASGRMVVEADWCAMPFAAASFNAALGDGALNMLRWSDGYRDAMSELRRILAPRGRTVIRCFVMPDQPETLSSLAADTMAGRVAGFHAFKWRLAMAARFENGPPDIGYKAIWQAFEANFPDRTAMSHATGWPIDTIAEIDDYAALMLSKSFPTRAELLAAVPGARFVETTGYELADGCPLLVIDRL
jgi:SAM-dependent methyltransferase